MTITLKSASIASKTLTAPEAKTAARATFLALPCMVSAMHAAVQVAASIIHICSIYVLNAKDQLHSEMSMVSKIKYPPKNSASAPRFPTGTPPSICKSKKNIAAAKSDIAAAITNIPIILLVLPVLSIMRSNTTLEQP